MISQDQAQTLTAAVTKLQDSLDTMHRAVSCHAKALKTLLEEIEAATSRANVERIDSEVRALAILEHARKLAAEANAPKTAWDARWQEIRAEKYSRLFGSDEPRDIKVVGPYGTSIPVSSPAFAKWLAEHPHADETPAPAQTVNHKAVSFDLEVLAGHQLHSWISSNPGAFGYTSISSDEYLSFSPEVRELLQERGILVETPAHSGKWRLNLAGAHAFLHETSGPASPKPEDDR